MVERGAGINQDYSLVSYIKRNPFNDRIRDHYARAMASYKHFVSACGFHLSRT